LGELIYFVISSLDGYIEDKSGKFDWAEPEEEVHRFVNDLERQAGTYLYGRRMYETMRAWETDPTLAAASPLMQDFATIWKAADKIVFSSSLEKASTSRTRIERRFHPELIRQLKANVRHEILIGGPELAGHAFKAGLVDKCHLFLFPIIVGGGKKGLPDDVRLRLKLEDQRRFGNGTIFLSYSCKV